MLAAKVMLLGEMGVGKTSIAQQLVFKKFTGNYKTTIGVELLTYDLVVRESDTTRRLVLWDTDGDFGMDIFDSVYVAGASAAMIVSDASRPHTISKMLDLVKNFEIRFPGRPYRTLINKMDLLEGDLAAMDSFNVDKDRSIFTSAKTGAGIEDGFADLAEDIYRRSI